MKINFIKRTRKDISIKEILHDRIWRRKELAWVFKFGENLWMKMDSSNLRSWEGHLANTEKLSTLKL